MYLLFIIKAQQLKLNWVIYLTTLPDSKVSEKNILKKEREKEKGDWCTVTCCPSD